MSWAKGCTRLLLKTRVQQVQDPLPFIPSPEKATIDLLFLQDATPFSPPILRQLICESYLLNAMCDPIANTSISTSTSTFTSTNTNNNTRTNTSTNTGNQSTPTRSALNSTNIPPTWANNSKSLTTSPTASLSSTNIQPHLWPDALTVM